MESKDIIIFILGFISAIAINFATHCFQKIRDKKNNFTRISDDIKKPFLETQSIFDQTVGGVDDTVDIKRAIRMLYSAQAVNIKTILPHLPRRKRAGLKDAWEKYENKINDESPSSWFDEQNIYKVDPNIIKKRKELVHLLDDILYFFDYHNMFSVFKWYKNRPTIAWSRRQNTRGSGGPLALPFN